MNPIECTGSGQPEDEKSVLKPVEKEVDLVDQVWERLAKTGNQDWTWSASCKAEGAAGLGIRVQDFYCAILLLYNDINKTLRPGPHCDPPTKREVQKCLKMNDEIKDDAMLDREEFNAFFEKFTKNAIRRNELQSFFKPDTNRRQFAPSHRAHTKQESDCSSQEPEPSRDFQDLYMKTSKEFKNTDAEELKAPNGSWSVLRHGRTDSAVNLNSFSGGSHFQIFNFASADLDSLASFVKQIRK